MRIIKPPRLREFWANHPTAKPSLERWLEAVKKLEWKTFAAVRESFQGADQARVACGKTVVVFNISGNHFRLITAIHYNVRKVHVLRFLTHAEYSKNSWKDDL
ncbi:MAG: type II toxin-antitoxin system HigB family toxin [Verrucomicrobia bacterium]|nr:type II toxin-antitoxin system HigB family toxin [Verrucomicrobiota bacterium]